MMWEEIDMTLQFCLCYAPKIFVALTDVVQVILQQEGIVANRPDSGGTARHFNLCPNL